MKKTTLFAFLLTVTLGFSQVNVTVDGSDTWNGYVIAFNAADDSYAFDFGYPIADIKTTVSATSVELQPNFLIWNNEATNPAWFDNPGTPPSNPNKKIEGLSFVEDNSLVGQAVNFSGSVGTIDIDPSYQVSAFIKILSAGFATLTDERVPLTATGDFTVSVSAAQTGAGAIVQYGFVVYGLIADPATEGTIGSVVVNQLVLSSNDLEINNFRVSPNPSINFWNIEGSNSVIDNVEVYDLLGKRVLNFAPNSQEVRIDATALKTGIYLAKLSSNGATKTIKLVKN